MPRNSRLFGFLLFFGLYELTVYLTNDMAMPAMPDVVRELHGRPADAALSLSLYIVGGSLLQLLLGPLAERVGERPVLLWGNAMFVVATLAVASCRTMPAFLAVRFVQGMGSVQVSGEIHGLKPNSEHGFHVHEKGDCSSGDGMSAGAHYNPGSDPHGKYDSPRHHAGDLPSLHADANGTATFSFSTSAFHVGREPADVIGKGLIVHRDPDDYSQPAGNSGPRLACAVIVRS